MTTLHERLQDEYGDALDELWKARGCKNDDPLYLRFLPYHATIRQLAAEVEAAIALQGSGGEVVAETMISHAREPHCIGCYVIRWNDGELVAQCNECGATVALLDGLASPAQPSDAKDAARYRWLRDPANDGPSLVATYGNEHLDAAIDALTAAPAPIEQEG